MSAKMRDLTPGRSPVHLLGALVRDRRVSLQLSQRELGRRTFVSGDMIRKVEHGTRFPSQAVAEALDRALHAGGEVLAAWRHAATARAGRSEVGAPTNPRQRESKVVLRTRAVWACRCSPRGIVLVRRAAPFRSRGR